MDPVTAIVRRSTELSEIATAINQAHRDATTALGRGIECARATGELLTHAKSLCGHGLWLDWLTANCRFDARQAQ